MAELSMICIELMHLKMDLSKILKLILNQLPKLKKWKQAECKGK